MLCRRWEHWNVDPVLYSQVFNLPVRFNMLPTQSFQNRFLASEQSRSWVSLSCTPSSFPPGIYWLLTSAPHPHQEVAVSRGHNERQLGNRLILFSKIFGRGDSWRWFIKWRPGLIWRFQLSINYIFLIVVQVHLSPFSPHHNPCPTHPRLQPSNSPPLAFSMCPFYMLLDGPPLTPIIPLPHPLWLLSDCSFFQCL